MKANRLQHDLLQQLFNRLEQARVTPEKLFRNTGISGAITAARAAEVFTGPEALVVLETAVKLTGDPCLALRLNDNIQIDSYGSLGFALMSCSNLRTSTNLLFRYGKLLFPQQWQAHEQGDDLLLRIDFAIGTPYQQQLIKELFLGALYRVSRLLHRGSLGGVELQLDYPAPAHRNCYRTVLPVPTTFDCEYTQLLIPARLLDEPVNAANPAEHVVFHQQCEEMLRGLAHGGKTTAVVRRLLIQSVGAFPDVAEVAENLHMSERTLRRHLDTEGTSFRAILDDIRNLLACEYLTDTYLPVADIAHLLGYNETVNFRRAFRRWNDSTPVEYRAQNATS